MSDEIREKAAEASKCMDPVRRKLLRKEARKERRELDADKAVLLRGEVVLRPVVTKTLDQWPSQRGH